MNRMYTNATPKLTLNSLELVEYGDFNCRNCRGLRKALTTTLTLFEGTVQYTYRHFPDLCFPQALLMGMAAEAARRQGQYWTMHRALFAHNSALTLHSVSALALALGLRLEPFLDDMHDETIKQGIYDDMEQGRLMGVTKTPTLFLDNHRLHGKLTQARLVPVIRQYVSKSTAPVLGTVDTERGLIYWSNSDYQ